MIKSVPQELILKSTSMILRYSIHQLVQIGMIEAVLEGPLQEMKGLINLGHRDPIDFDLLESLDVPKFKRIIESVIMIHEHIETYLNLYGLQEDDCEADPQALEFANLFFWPFTYGNDNKFQFWETAWVYLMTMGLIDALRRLHFEHGFENDNEKAFLSFYDPYLEGHYKPYPKPRSPSAAVQLWYELYIKMEQGYIEIQNFE